MISLIYIFIQVWKSIYYIYIYIYIYIYVFFLLKYPWSKKNGPAFQLFLKYIIKQMPWVFKTPCVINYNKVIQKRTFWLCNLWNFIWKSKGLFQFQLKTRTCLKHFKNELNFCKEFGSEDKLYCGTYCYNSCNTFSRSESGAETRSQTFQFLIDILNQNQDVEQVSTDI